jgi:Flp pilus assembly protein TadD
MMSVSDSRRQHIDSLLLVVLAAAVYGRILGHEFQANWDDNWYVIYNESIRGFSWQNLRTIFSSIYLANYAPVQMLSYMLDYTVWGLNAGGFLFTNIIIHAMNGIMLYRMLFRWYGERLFALVASALFLVHPLQVESVAWVSDRKNLLSVFFFLLAWEGYRLYREAAPGKGRLAYTASVAAFVISLLSKSTTLVLPVILVLYDLCFPEGGRRLRLKDKMPYVLAAGVFALVTFSIQTSEFQGGIRIPYHGGSPLATFYTMLPVFCRYLGNVVWPAGLSALYSPPVHSSIDGAVAAAAFLIAVVIWAGIRLFRIDRRLGFWVMFFWIGLLPYSQIVPIMWLMNDRYLNLSMIGVAALAGSGAVFLRERLGAQRPVLLYALLALPVVALSVVSFQRAAVWRDGLTLWSDTVLKTPASSRAWEHLGEVYKFTGKTDSAREAYERGLTLDPSNTEILYGLGDLYTELGELDKGYALLKDLLRIKPGYVMGWASLGNNYLKRGNYVEAEKAYKLARALQPDAMQVVMLLGDLALIQGRLDQARDYYGQIEAKGWNDPDIAFQLACVESRSGRKREALNWIETALRRGYRDYNKFYNEELSSLWEQPQFHNLLRQYFPEQEGGR